VLEGYWNRFLQSIGFPLFACRSTILRLRSDAPEHADRILNRAWQYHQAATA
jgi:hypothetical protein